MKIYKRIVQYLGQSLITEILTSQIPFLEIERRIQMAYLEGDWEMVRHFSALKLAYLKSFLEENDET